MTKSTTLEQTASVLRNTSMVQQPHPSFGIITQARQPGKLVEARFAVICNTNMH